MNNNLVLKNIPENEYKQLQPHFEEIDLPLGTQLLSRNETLQYMYFPTSGIVSLLMLLENGGTGEIALVGNEGVVGVSTFASGDSPSYESVVQSVGAAIRIPVKIVLKVFQENTAFQYSLLRYSQALFMQISQTALCNRHHSILQQLGRWLLLSFDRIESREIVMTQEMIANMLGVRRAGVTVAAGELQKLGLISYKRGQIRISEKQKLIDFTCECYTAIRKEYKNYSSAIKNHAL